MAGVKRKASPACNINKALRSDDDVVKVKVSIGSGEKMFTVHEQLIRDSSSFFRTALQTHWKEGQDRLVCLPEDDPETFRIYLNWLYTGKLLYIADYDVDEGDTHSATYGFNAGLDPVLRRLGKAYIFSDKIGDFDFKDATFDAQLRYLAEDDYNDVDLPIDIYNHTSESSPARKFVVDDALFHWKKDMFELCRKDVYPRDFWNDLIIASYEMKKCKDGTQDPRKGDLCKYHEHTITGKPCYKSRWE